MAGAARRQPRSTVAGHARRVEGGIVGAGDKGTTAPGNAEPLSAPSPFPACAVSSHGGRLHADRRHMVITTASFGVKHAERHVVKKNVFVGGMASLNG